MLPSKRLIIPAACLFILSSLQAQTWVNQMQNPDINFYTVQKSFNKYWKKQERVEKLKSFFTRNHTGEDENEGYEMYSRWANFTGPRVFPSGDRSLLKAGNDEITKLITDQGYRSKMLAGGNWQPMGAMTVPTNGGGAGRLNGVRFNPTNSNIIYACAPAGGLWKSTNGGNTWSCNTDQLPTLGVTDVAVDPTNANIMYLGTGDLDAGDTYSVGVLKSTDGGITWNITGFNYNVNQGKLVSRVLINPNDHNMLFVGASSGIYKSTDAGTTWLRVLNASNIKDMEFKPGDPTVVYATSANNFYKSSNTGNTFLPITAGLPLGASVTRAAIAVTPADPSYVYLVYSAVSSNAFKGLYRSTDGGITFTLQADSPNVLGSEWDGSSTTGQGWYTLSIAVSPTNKNEVVIGGVNIWKSGNGGVDWNIIAHWWGANGTPYVHADVHDLIYNASGTKLFAGCDGGIFETDDGGNSWTDKSAGLQIGQMYRLGCSATNANLVMQGWQDNGSNLYLNGIWSRPLGGDGMETFVDWSNASYIYAETQYGGLCRSSNGGNNFNGIVNNISESGEWITPWCQDPTASHTIYAGFDNVWKSTDRGDTWTQISSFNSGGLKSLVVAKTNHNYIYASNGSNIYRTVNGGTIWTNFNISGNTNAITYLTVSTTTPTTLWATCSGYSAGNKVFKSINGGNTWTNISGNLPNIPVNCIVNQTGTNDGVYVGTDLGVYYHDENAPDWIPFSNGLPNVVVDELEIQYSSGKLRAATYGRGLWQTAIYNPSSTLPFPNFAGDTLSGCPGLTVHFSDSTHNSPTAWSWRFPGGTPSVSTLQNPVVTYNSGGVYQNVTLVVTNAFGVDSVTKYSYISISPNVIPTISFTGNDTICQGTSLQLRSSQAQTYLWHPNGTTNYAMNVTSSGTFSVTTMDAFNCATTSAPLSITVLPIPPTPTITIHADTLFSSAAAGNQWLLNGLPIAGATNSYYITPAFGGTYNVTVRDSFSICSSTSANFVGINENENTISYSLFPNPANQFTTLSFQVLKADDIQIEITDAIGKRVFSKNYPSASGKMEVTIDLSVYQKGIYLFSLKNSDGASTKKLVIY